MILALDFDGVLHPRLPQHEPLFCRMNLLEDWLRAHAEVDVLISSSWREFHPFDEMREYFSEDLRARVVGATPIARQLFKDSRLPEDAHRAIYERQFEIEAWCRSRDLPDDSWLALDDDDRLFEPSCSQLVLCDAKVGLRSETLCSLTHMLNLCARR